MYKYVVMSETPIRAEEVGSGGGGGSPGEPSHPWVPPSRPEWPERPAHPWIPSLPPRDEWPPLPPWFDPGVGLPIPPTPEHPIVPLPPTTGGPDEPEIWPPVRPEFPDLSGKSLALALVYVSRHVAKLHWVIIDHEEAKKAWQALKDRLPAGGIGGTPPQRPGGIQPR